MSVTGACYKALGDECSGAVELLYELLCGLLGKLKVHDALTVVVIGADDLANVDPQVADTNGVEIVADDGGGDELTETDCLVIVVVVVGGLLGTLLRQMVEKLVEVLINRMARVTEELTDNLKVVVAEFFQHEGVFGLGTHTRDQLFQSVGGLTHGGDHNH